MSDVASAIGRHQSRRSRAEAAEALNHLLARGKTKMGAFRILGISSSYGYAILNDPEGLRDKARKERHRGTCKGCGRPTTGSDGREHAPEYCNHCAPAVHHGKWTHEGIIFALQEIARVTGEVPRAKVAFTGGYNHLPIKLEGEIGGVGTTTQRLFGSWNNAIAAAGMTPRRPGVRGPGRKTSCFGEAT